MTDKKHQKNPHKLPKLKQFVVYEGTLIHLICITAFRYFYSDKADKWYLGYYTNTGEWQTLDSSFDEDVIKQKLETLKEELFK